MRSTHYRWLAHQVQEQTIALIQRQLRPRDFSKRCTAGVLLSCLILAAAARLALSAVACLRHRCPSRETLRNALRQTLPGYQALLQQLPRLLRASLPRGLRKHSKRRYPLAIDLHAVAYYKRNRTPPEHVRKGKRLPGTAYSHQYATASLLRKGQYYVVALTPYNNGENMAELVRRLLRQAAHNGFSPRYVLMDRSFWSAEIFRYLQQARYPFLLPVLARGKKPTTEGGPTGTQALLHGLRQTGWYPYRVQSSKGVSAQVMIAVHRRNYRGWHDKRGRYTWAYAMWRMDLSRIQWVRQSYRRRFRIESSYKLMEACRGRTNSRDEGWRLWHVVLAALLLNYWLQLRHRCCRQGMAAQERWWRRLLAMLMFQLLLESALADEATDSNGPSQQ